MERYDIKIEAAAETDIRGIVRYMRNELHEPITADRIKKRIYQECASLDIMPKRYPLSKIPSLARKGYRIASAGTYLIFYTVNSSTCTVHIKRIIHGKRNWQSLLQNPQ